MNAKDGSASKSGAIAIGVEGTVQLILRPTTKERSALVSGAATHPAGVSRCGQVTRMRRAPFLEEGLGRGLGILEK